MNASYLIILGCETANIPSQYSFPTIGYVKSCGFIGTLCLITKSGNIVDTEIAYPAESCNKLMWILTIIIIFDNSTGRKNIECTKSRINVQCSEKHSHSVT